MELKQQIRRFSAKLLRPFQWLFIEINLNDILRGIGKSIKRWVNFFTLPPAVIGRKFLQLFIKRISATRYFTHVFVVVVAIVISAANLIGASDIDADVQSKNLYVTAFGSAAASSRYSTFVDEGYLAKSNVVQTDISTLVAAGIQEYSVQPGDTLSTIAGKFNTTVRTIQWTNQIDNPNRLRVGQVVKVFEGTGIVHEVEEGQSVEGIAEKHGSTVEEIIASNELVEPVRLATGQSLVVPLPNNKVPEITPPQPTYTAVSSSPSTSSAASVPVINAGPGYGTGSFGWPASGKITRGCREHGPRDCALDINNRSYPPIVASDSGTVIVSKWDSTGYGYRIDIDHGNGFVTRYAHNTANYVVVGQRVEKGQVIAKMGSTGRSTGPHSHFMIIYRGVPQDPRIYLP